MPIHEVHIDNFFIGKYEVTVRQYSVFVNETNYLSDAERQGSAFVYNEKNGRYRLKKGVNWRHDEEGNIRKKSEDNYPVIHVSWEDAGKFISWLNEKTDENYRLPTEAEWEYVAGNGVAHTIYSWGNGQPNLERGDNIPDDTPSPNFKYTWSSRIKGYRDGHWFSAPVGSFSPNELGVYDMGGNVFEWCYDRYDKTFYSQSPKNNPKGPHKGIDRVLRGGSWDYGPDRFNVYSRGRGIPNKGYYNLGFRVSKDIK